MIAKIPEIKFFPQFELLSSIIQRATYVPNLKDIFIYEAMIAKN